MAALITELIDKTDNVEVIRDQIAAILALESANQEFLALSNRKDPRLWAMQVYLDRENPWSEFSNPEEYPEQADVPRIVNVSFDRETFDKSRSDMIQRQMSSGTFNVDCYACGISGDDASGGHIAGDQVAAAEAMRLARHVRNILMSAQYFVLGMTGIVGSRFPSGIELMRVPQNDRPAQHTTVARLSLDVTFNEFSPQYVPTTLETLTITFQRASDGQVLIVHEAFAETP